MLGKTKVDATEKGVRLQARNNKWYKYIALVQMALFAVMHLILGMYFAFVSSEYVNHPGFTTKIEAHRNMDQICAIICFVLFVVGLRAFYGLMKHKRISTLYYVYMAVSAILPIVYLLMSDAFVFNAMLGILEEGYPEFIEAGDAGEMVFWTGIEFGAWTNGSDISSESEIILEYLSRIGAEAGTEMSLANFDLDGLLDAFRTDMYAWNKFELYSIINVVVTAVFAVCGIIFLPFKKSKLFKK